ncbi:MAG: hypothetical protein IKP50_00275 [Bacilli bacterium]|nr:hypothetical protein [Bacilli bacterium]
MKLELNDLEVIKQKRQKVEVDAHQLDEIVSDITTPYTKDLDAYVDFIRSILTDTQKPPTTQELDDFCMNLSMYIYYASGMQEQLGVKDDIARALYKEMYHSQRDSIEKGTIADKDSIAELKSQEEYLVSVLYKHAYNTVKAKVASAQELLSSIKKVISRRMEEMNLTHISGGM